MMAGKKEIKLVPTEEQPYEIPENWCWVYLTAGFAECLDSFRKPINSTERADRFGDVPYYGATGQVGWIDDYLTDDHLVLVGEDGAPFLDLVKEKAYIIEGKAWVNNHAHILRSHYGKTGNVYLMNYLNIFDFTNYVNGTTRLKLTQASMNTIPVPLAPIAEQKRIVDTIVDLFADLDKAAESAEKIVKQHDERRANLLHSAITGELTVTWRQAHGVDINDWTSSKIDDLCYSLKYGTAKKSKKTGPVVVLRMGNMQEGEIDWTDLAYTDDEEDIAKYHLEPGDVLFNRTNSATHVGKTSIYRGEYPAIYAGYLIKLDYDHSRVVGNYLTYALNTPTAREYCQSVKTDGVNQSNINARKIGAFSIPLPSMDEQQEIVRILDELLGNEQRIKEAAEEMLDKIAMMKKSILADAFRGKLGTNDPADEPATELLRQILA